MDIAEIIVKFVNRSGHASVLNDLAKSCANILDAEISMICETFVYTKIEDLAENERTENERKEKLKTGAKEFDLKTLGFFSKNSELQIGMSWIPHFTPHGMAFHRICKGETIMSAADQIPPIHNFVGVPIFDRISETMEISATNVIGILVVANLANFEDSAKKAQVLTRTLIDTIRIILSHKIHHHMHKVVESVVDHIQIPIAIFQRRPYSNDSSDLSNFCCLMHNQAFCTQILASAQLGDDSNSQVANLVGGGLYQCFPQLKCTPKIHEPLLKLFRDPRKELKDQKDQKEGKDQKELKEGKDQKELKEPKEQLEQEQLDQKDQNDDVALANYETVRGDICLEAVEYEDMLVSKNIYTIKFSKVDASTFIFSIENISEQVRAKMLAEEIAQAKEQFVANVSHEIRTPLNGILGYIAMMSDPRETTTLTEYQTNCFSQIKDCSMNLLSIMNDILDFSKLNADQMQLKSEPFELSELLEKSYDVILPSAHDKGLEGAFLIDANVPPTFKGDFKKLRQILLNLLSNGIKFTPRGRVDTTVKMVRDDVTGADIDVRGRHTLEFCVHDTGIGISSKDQTKLFKSFSQIDQSHRKIYQGTGLGLVISRKLVELMGGKIWVESNVGDGSRFYFTVKLEEARVEEIQSKYLPIIKDKMVLVVDDHATNRITISSYLLRWGMKPVICGSAEEALLYLRGSVMQFDMALIDMRMPKMDGNELASKIHSLVPTLPLVAISSQPLGPTGTKEINQFFLFYLSKPIRHRQLFNVCVAVIKRARVSKIRSPPSAISKLQLQNASPPIDHLPPPKLERKYVYNMPAPCLAPTRSFLIVEDLVTNQRVVIGFLQKLGFSDFTIADDGIAALNLLRQRKFDVILMDLKMPGIDGFETTRRIRQMYKDRAQGPFIIALTANAMNGVREKCVDAGMDAYMTKPIDMSELAQILNEAVI